jgi:excisionase family DNA binding protein
MEESADKQNPEPIEPLLTSREVADRMKVSERHIQNLVKRGEFPPPIRLGKAVRYRPSDVQSFLDGNFEPGQRDQAS